MKFVLPTTLLLFVFAVGCASAPPELIEARETYQSVKEGPASQYAPAELQEAQEALDRAEMAFDKEGEDDITKVLAYVAIRKSQKAVVAADIFLAEQAKAEREKELLATSELARKKLQNKAQMTSQQLEAERIRLEGAKKDLEAAKKRGELTEAELKKNEAELKAKQLALAATEVKLAEEKKAR